MPQYRVTYTLVDSQTPQGQTTKVFEFTATDDAAAATAETAFRTDFNAVTTMGIQRVVGPAKIEDVGDSASSGSDAVKGLSASIFLNAAGKRGNLTVPAPVSAILSGNSLNPSAADFLAYLENFTSGGGGFEISDGENARGFTASDVSGGKVVVVRANRRLPI